MLHVTQLQALFLAGGVVLQVLALTAFILWSLLLGKIWFAHVEFPRQLKRARQALHQSNFQQLIGASELSLAGSMRMIRTTINVCPLLGLTGTVVGMIEIFDVIGYSGVANAQLMAAAVARAILPTMAGMVIAISAMFVFAYLQRWIIAQRSILARLSLTHRVIHP